MRFMLGASLAAAWSMPAAAQTVTVYGTCPGTLYFHAAGLTPGGEYQVLSAATTGSQAMLTGPCAGVVTDLGADRFSQRIVRTADGDGVGEAEREMPGAACSFHLQIIDLETCELSGTFDMSGALPATCEEALARGGDRSGTYLLDAEGLGVIDAVCDMDTEGGGWLDLVGTMHLPGADVETLADSFFVTNGVGGTQITVTAESGAVSGDPGLLVINSGYDGTHERGFHLWTDLSWSSARLAYRMQGSNFVSGGGDRCGATTWIPLSGPGFNGGFTTNYLSPCPPGYLCPQGSPEYLRDAPLNVAYAVDGVDSSVTLPTWSGSQVAATSTGCARDAEIPTSHPATYFTGLLLR
jgi:hypothetical protein